MSRVLAESALKYSLMKPIPRSLVLGRDRVVLVK